MILDRDASDVRSSTNLIQWTNSGEVIEWFNKVEHRNRKCFITFDIFEFYPSIKRNHLIEALDFTKKLSEITDDDIRIIMH